MRTFLSVLCFLSIFHLKSQELVDYYENVTDLTKNATKPTSITRSDYFEHKDKWDVWPKNGLIFSDNDDLIAQVFSFDFGGFKPLAVRNTTILPPFPSFSYLINGSSPSIFTGNFTIARKHSRDFKSINYSHEIGLLYAFNTYDDDRITSYFTAHIDHHPWRLNVKKKKIKVELFQQLLSYNQFESNWEITTGQFEVLKINEIGYYVGFRSTQMPNFGRNFKMGHETTFDIGPSWSSYYEYKTYTQKTKKTKRQRIVTQRQLYLSLPVFRNYLNINYRGRTSIFNVYDGNASLRFGYHRIRYDMYKRNSFWFMNVSPSWTIEPYVNLNVLNAKKVMSGTGIRFVMEI